MNEDSPTSFVGFFVKERSWRNVVQKMEKSVSETMEFGISKIEGKNKFCEKKKFYMCQSRFFSTFKNLCDPNQGNLKIR